MIFPVKITIHILGTAEMWNNEGECIGTCPVDIEIHEISSLCFHYHNDLSLIIADRCIPPVRHAKSSVSYEDGYNGEKYWTMFYYDPNKNSYSRLFLSYCDEGIPEYVLCFEDIEYRIFDIYEDK